MFIWQLRHFQQNQFSIYYLTLIDCMTFETVSYNILEEKRKASTVLNTSIATFIILFLGRIETNKAYIV